ncbi:uncharacterized protein LOC144100303 [Amblyomma americanum]
MNQVEAARTLGQPVVEAVGASCVWSVIITQVTAMAGFRPAAPTHPGLRHQSVSRLQPEPVEIAEAHDRCVRCPKCCCHVGAMEAEGRLPRHLGDEPSGSRVFRGHSHSIDCQLSPRRCLLQPHGLQCQPCSLVLVATLNGAQTTSGGAVDHFYPPSSSAARPDSMFCLEAKARLHRLPSGTLQRQRTSSYPQVLLRISGTDSLPMRRLLQTKSGWAYKADSCCKTTTITGARCACWDSRTTDLRILSSAHSLPTTVGKVS